MTTREEFLAPIRAALAADRGSVPSPRPGAAEHLVRLVGHDADLAATFAVRAAATGMHVHRCSQANLQTTLTRLLTELRVSTVSNAPPDSHWESLIRAAFESCSITSIYPGSSAGLDAQFDVDAGITGVLCAIAESGTLVVVSDRTRSRGTFIVPPIHIAIVNESQIVPDLVDVWSTIGSQPPTAVTLISGPSKTADIEGILVTGVHGPRAVHIVLVEATHNPVRSPVSLQKEAP